MTLFMMVTTQSLLQKRFIQLIIMQLTHYGTQLSKDGIGKTNKNSLATVAISQLPNALHQSRWDCEWYLNDLGVKIMSYLYHDTQELSSSVLLKYFI